MACSESNAFFLSNLHLPYPKNQIIRPCFIRLFPTIVNNVCFSENWKNNRIELVHKLLITPGFSLFSDTS